MAGAEGDVGPNPIMVDTLQNDPVLGGYTVTNAVFVPYELQDDLHGCYPESGRDFTATCIAATGYETCPARLVTHTNAGAVIAVEVFVEVVSIVAVELTEWRNRAITRPPAAITRIK